MTPPLSETSSFDAALRALIHGGLPLGRGKGGAAAPTRTELGVAVCALVSNPDVEPWISEAVGAYLLAWAHEWPVAFEETFGEATSALITWSRRHTPDRNRYLKLRRMAIGNLAGVL